MSTRTQPRPLREHVLDCVLPGEKQDAAIEAAYRRGFQQGAFLAVDAARRGCSLADLKHWAAITLHRWRCRGSPWCVGSQIKPIRPPDPRYPKGKEPWAFPLW
jgi:hypothetical protein